MTLQPGRERYIILGEVVWLHVRDGIVDPATLRVAPDYAPIGRLFGNGYVRTHDRFELPRLTFEEWRARQAKALAFLRLRLRLRLGEADGADRHGDGGLGRVDHRQADRVLDLGGGTAPCRRSPAPARRRRGGRAAPSRSRSCCTSVRPSSASSATPSPIGRSPAKRAARPSWRT